MKYTQLHYGVNISTHEVYFRKQKNDFRKHEVDASTHGVDLGKCEVNSNTHEFGVRKYEVYSITHGVNSSTNRSFTHTMTPRSLLGNI